MLITGEFLIVYAEVGKVKIISIGSYHMNTGVDILLE
jgi:hypothetical protein